MPVRSVSAPLLLLFAAPVAISTAPLTERALTAAAVRMLKGPPDVSNTERRCGRSPDAATAAPARCEPAAITSRPQLLLPSVSTTC